MDTWIVELIWSYSEGLFGFLPHKHFGRWQEIAVPVPASPAQIADLVKDQVGYDSYFSVSLFNDTRRIASNQAETGVLYADLDAVDPRGLSISPSVAWETSPGSFQAVWLLSTPLDPDNHRILNKAMSLYVGADKGSWIPTKVLRVPGTLNWKRQVNGIPPRGQVLWVNKQVVYRPDELEEVLPMTESRRIVYSTLPPLPADAERDRAISWPQMSLSLRSLVSRKIVSDRSDHIRKAAKQFAREGFTIRTAFAFISVRPWNKWRHDPMKLMVQIADAFASIE